MENTDVSHYRVGRLLGRGGMGEVYEALDLDLDRRVALKFIAPELAASAESLRRFEREARAAAALNHPNIAILHDLGRDGPRPYLVMELLSGETLRDRMIGPMPIGEALAMARDVAAGLATAHRGGIVHRDLKPENLMFDGHGTIKITDFGLARVTQRSRLTTEASLMGTASYLAPESVRGSSESPADVFALGIILHEMISGQLPFTGESPLAQIYSITNLLPHPLREARPDAPEAVERLIARMLEKDPMDRPSSHGVARELGTLTGRMPAGVGGDTEVLETTKVPSAASAPAPPSSPAGLVPAEPARRPRRTPLLWIGIALVGGAGLVAWGMDARGRAAHRVEAVALVNEGRDSLLAGNLDAARERLTAALTRDPGSAEAKLNLGMVAMRSGDDSRAADFYGQVLREHTSDSRLAATSHYNLGEIDMRAGAWPSAIDHLEKAVELDSSQAAYVNNLGFALIESGRADDGLVTLEGAARWFPAEAMIHKNLGLARFRLGDLDGALSALDRALSLDPRLAPALALRAQARARQGDVTGARADLEALTAVDPRSSEIAALEAEIGAAERQAGRRPRPARVGR